MRSSSRGAPATVIKGTSHQIADALRDQIRRGALAPGAPLNQAMLAAQFGLSRIPVREALRALEADGYIIYQPNKGASVAQTLPPSELHEIVEMRECIEARLLAHALDRIASSDIARATDVLRSIARARAGDDVRGLHEQFHTALLAPANRPRMLETVNTWRFRYDDPASGHLYAFFKRMAGVHKRLLAACSAHDAAAAQAALAEEYQLFHAWLSEPDS